MCALVGLCKFLRAMPLGVVECTWNIAPATPVQVFKPKLYHQLLTSVLFKGNSTVASWHRDMRDVTVWWLHQWYWICLFAGPWSCKSNQTTHKYSIGQVPWRLRGQLQRVFFRSEELATSIVIFSNMHFVGGVLNPELKAQSVLLTSLTALLNVRSHFFLRTDWVKKHWWKCCTTDVYMWYLKPS